MKINPRHYILIIFALASVVISSFAYIFIYRQTLVQEESYMNATGELENEDNKKQNEKDFAKIYSDTTDDRARLGSFLVSEDSAVDFIEKIEKIGIDSKVKLELSSINTADNKIRAKVDIAGHWTEIMNALMLIENLPLSSTINNINMDVSGGLTTTESKLSKTPPSPMWRLSFTIEALTIKKVK